MAQDDPAFDRSSVVETDNPKDKKKDDLESEEPERAMWGSQLEFLMSCIATSVGLGNVWRFPFQAFQNGGGAFLVPYIIVLFLIGKPMYYLECILGQFSSKNSIEVWTLSPAMKGIGYAQAMGCSYILSYYVSIIALCIFYLVMSFQKNLPWTVCKDEWENCVPSSQTSDLPPTIQNGTSSAELYFLKTVIQQKDGIEGGIGAPIWYLTLCLFVSWLIVFLIVARGVKSSGKASYFLAIFPYIIMIILLINTVILKGAGNGILFFLTPQWDKLLDLKVWYNAVTQVFFSLTVSTGAIIMFSSYNGFRQNIYRDAMIVTTLDTFTSLLSGITIFGILGNLAYVTGREVKEVIGSAGTGLAFISYPDAISKTFQPQLFAVMFFVMMTVLGVGSAVALLQTLNTVMMDAFPKVSTVYMSALCCTAGFLVGLVYVTPGGQYVLELVDYYGVTILILFAGIIETVAVFWIYGLEKFCLDVEFMLGIKTSFYWRLCWGLITPGLMLTVFIYAMTLFNAFTFNNVYTYPPLGYAAGYTMVICGMLMLPLCIGIALYRNWNGDLKESIKLSFKSASTWGPRNTETRREWVLFIQEGLAHQQKNFTDVFAHTWKVLTGGYRRKIS